MVLNPLIAVDQGQGESALAEIASEINGLHADCERSAGEAIGKARRAGELLIQAKALCRHGEWLPWLSEFFAGSVRTAQVYMRVAVRWAEVQSKCAGNAHLSLADAAQMLAAPKRESPELPPLSDTDELWLHGTNGELAIIGPHEQAGYRLIAIYSGLDELGGTVEFTKRGVADHAVGRFLRVAGFEPSGKSEVHPKTGFAALFIPTYDPAAIGGAK